MNQNNIYYGQGYEDERIVNGETIRLLRGAFGSFDGYNGKGLLLLLEKNHHPGKRRFYELFIPEREANLLLEELKEKPPIHPRDILAHFDAQKEIVAVSA